jgi:hypothetical protein
MSVTLKEIIALQPISGDSDIDIIKQWFILNGQEAEGIAMISDLSASKVNRLERILRNAQSWIPVVPDVYESNSGKVPKDVANKLNQLTKLYLLDLRLSDELFTWARKTIPTMKIPTCIFVPMVEWLETEYGIKFKDR